MHMGKEQKFLLLILHGHHFFHYNKDGTVTGLESLGLDAFSYLKGREMFTLILAKSKLLT